MAERARERYPALFEAAQALVSQKRFNDAYVLLEVEAGIPPEAALQIRAECVPQIPRPRPWDKGEHEAFQREQKRRAAAIARSVRDELSRVENDHIHRPSMRELADACTARKEYHAATFEVLTEVCSDG